ncbi:glyoxalase/bleomycin resistance/extradiol dioxygenase family protein [Streptomyces sp. NBC_01476]|uniref:VOC family protein n=1 Tax=Streptomyces sp. NBC_01476 TaxID=2903881 RepID=UPI002E35CAA3|nr:VOC family protein [Streptomyces sp. NBC_01476]
MTTKIFVNLPVKDLEVSTSFFTALGYHFDPDYTDDKAGCLVLGDDIFVMLLVEPYFTHFTGRPVMDTAAGNEAIVALGLDTRADVDRVADAALGAGGKQAHRTEEQSPMYTRSFYDPDGHHWEIFALETMPA